VRRHAYGERDVDGRLLHDHARQDDIARPSLRNGCVCGDLSADLTATIAALLQQDQRDALCLETTGLAKLRVVPVTGDAAALEDTSDLVEATRGV